MENSALKGSGKDELVITRDFDAPRDLLWKAWTEPKHVMAWWGPKGFTSPACKIDLRVGGKFLSAMRSPQGDVIWGVGTYRELVKPERIVVTDSFANEKGEVVPGTHYGMSASFPLELLITLTFETISGGTRMTLKHAGIGGLSDADREGMRQGWSESFDKLAVYLKKM